MPAVGVPLWESHPRPRAGCARCSRRAWPSARSCPSRRCCSASSTTAAELTGARYAALGVIDRSRHAARAVPHDWHRRRDPRRDRRTAAGRRHPRRAHRRGHAAPPPRPPRGSAVGRVSAVPPTDEHVPRRPDHAPRRRLRKFLLDREGGRRGLHDEDEEMVDAARGAGGGRDRERAPLRGGDAVVEAARVVERGRQRARNRDRSRAGSSISSPAGCASCSTRASSTVLLPAGDDELRFAAVAGEGGDDLPRADNAARRVEDRPRARARTERADRLGARRSGGRAERSCAASARGPGSGSRSSPRAARSA